MPKTLLLLTTLLALTAPVALAQTSDAAMTMPLNVNLLPYGTVTVADGNYYIPNYQDTGIAIYIQSAKSLPVATLDQSMAAQAAWVKYMAAVNTPAKPVAVTPAASTTPAAVTPAATPVAAKPAAPVVATTAATPMPQTTPVNSVASTAPAAQTAPTVAPAKPAAPSFPAAKDVFGKTSMKPAPAAPAPVAAAAVVPAPNATVAPAPSSTRLADSSLTATTSVPNWLNVSFRGRNNATSFTIANRSMQTVTLTPTNVRAFQNGQPVPANLSVRASADSENGSLAGKGTMTGTITVLTKSTAPITVTWDVQDARGHAYPIAYAWLPE